MFRETSVEHAATYFRRSKLSYTHFVSLSPRVFGTVISAGNRKFLRLAQIHRLDFTELRSALDPQPLNPSG